MSGKRRDPFHELDALTRQCRTLIVLFDRYQMEEIREARFPPGTHPPRARTFADMEGVARDLVARITKLWGEPPQAPAKGPR